MENDTDRAVKKNDKPERFSLEWCTRIIGWMLPAIVFSGLSILLFPKLAEYIDLLSILGFFCVGVIFMIQPLTLISWNLKFRRFLVGEKGYKDNPNYDIETYNTKFRRIYGRVFGTCMTVFSGSMFIFMVVQLVKELCK